MTNTPMSLSTRSSRLSEANSSTSRSSLNVPEHHELGKSPIMERVKEAAVESAAVSGGSKTKGNKAASTICTTVTDKHGVESATSTSTTHATQSTSVTFMRPRYSRRVHSKSEPHATNPATASGSIVGNESPAKRIDDNITTVRIMRGSLVIAQHD
jgi:hypothetical protein